MTVSVLDLAPSLSTPILRSEERENVNNPTQSIPNETTAVFDVSEPSPLLEQTTQNLPAKLSTPNITSSIPPISEDVSLRQFSRIKKAPDQFGNNIYDT